MTLRSTTFCQQPYIRDVITYPIFRIITEVWIWKSKTGIPNLFQSRPKRTTVVVAAGRDKWLWSEQTTDTAPQRALSVWLWTLAVECNLHLMSDPYESYTVKIKQNSKEYSFQMMFNCTSLTRKWEFTTNQQVWSRERLVKHVCTHSANVSHPPSINEQQNIIDLVHSTLQPNASHIITTSDQQ